MKKQLLLFAILCLVSFFPRGVEAVVDLEQCLQQAAHSSVTYLLIDRSDPVEDKASFRKSILALKAMIQPGERLVIGVSGERGGDTTIVMDSVKPEESIWSSTLKIRAQQKRFDECFDQITEKLISTDETHSHSAILETLLFVSKVLSSESAAVKRLVIYSDMQQNSPQVSFYTKTQLKPAAIIAQIEKAELLSSFAGTEVFAAGTGAHVSDTKAIDLEKIWRAYFERSGARLKFYGAVLINF